MNILNDIDIDNNHFNVIYPDLNSTNSSKYYEIEHYNKLEIDTNTDFSLLNFNIRSLSANFDLFNGFLSLLDSKFDVITFTESWLKENNKNLCIFDGHCELHNLRIDGRRGDFHLLI